MSRIHCRDSFEFELKNGVTITVETEGTVIDDGEQVTIEDFELSLATESTLDYRRTLDMIVIERGEIETRAENRLADTAQEEKEAS